MKILNNSLAIMLVFGIIITGCSGGGNLPVLPDNDSSITMNQFEDTVDVQQHLWGYYEVYVDLESQEVKVVPLRNTSFTANIMTFLNLNPANLSFAINSVKIDPGYSFTDVDLDVSITHPFADMPKYDGYDVKGIFIGNESATMAYNNDLKYGVNGLDQTIINYWDCSLWPWDDPPCEFICEKTCGSPDGWTRWFNPPEFTEPGIFGYTPGVFATSHYTGTSTLNPYKYFADNLGVCDGLWEFLTTTQDNGIFTSGSTNTRNYYLRFPTPDPNVVFNYAIAASWEDPDLAEPPNNAPEAMGCRVEVTDDIYFDGDWGGNLIADISLYGWEDQPDAVFLETPLLGGLYTLNPAEMTPTGGGSDYSTYSVDIPVVTDPGVIFNSCMEFWVIAEHQGHDYTNEFGIPNSAGEDFLAAFFREGVFISDVPYNLPPVCDLVIDPGTPVPAEDWSPIPITFDATGSYDPDPLDTLTFSWDFDGDEIFDEPEDAYSGPPDNPTYVFTEDYNGLVRVKVEDNHGDFVECSVPVDIAAHPSKNIEISLYNTPARDICMDHANGDILLYYHQALRVRRYHRSTYFETFDEYADNVRSDYDFMDMSPNGYYSIGQVFASGIGWNMYHYDNSGYFVSAQGGMVWGGTYFREIDVVGMGSSGTWANHHVWFKDWVFGATSGIVYARTYAPPGYTTGPYYTPNLSGSETGPDKIQSRWIVACEPEDGDYVWHLQSDPNYYVNRWTVSTSYGNGSWGTGSATDGNTGINDPLDVTRDDNNNFYILDELSTGEYTIKAFNWNGSTTTSLSSFGDSDDWEYTPIRIEGCDYDGVIAVLQTYTYGGYISIFTEEETSG